MVQYELNDLLTVLKNPELVGLLDRFAEACTASRQRGDLQLSRFNSYDLVRQTFVIKAISPTYHVLIWRDTGEQVVLACQGLVASVYFPPVTAQTRVNPRAAHRSTQSVTIVGPGSTSFTSSLSAIKQIYRYFEQNFGMGEMRALQTDHVGDVAAIVGSTRYVTPTSYKIWPDVGIPDSIDPDGILKRIVGEGKYAFTEDNVVSYRVVDERSLEVSDAQPSVFHQGHVVDIGVSFRAMKGRKQYSFIIQLESILLGEREGAKLLAELVSDANRHPASMVVEPVLLRKRHIEHTKEDLAETQKRLHTLTLSDSQMSEIVE
ncbi:hypothetical protein A0H81_12769 [Grifola frondosa]|uniref:Uncharacterized protein n=1 Tax=Grifola frondosa TaxID=5627 RepID=A0A1C7LR63_GRIFR|nr:hypothetical protein A0H81_12769 [Grifola frondosa]